eukprot:m.161207 g.161207  ORF g.161207 m.161207 type:complete len:531 (+) comp12050_c0_seq1:25-1617(+)
MPVNEATIPLAADPSLPGNGVPELALLKVPAVDAAVQTAAALYNYGKIQSTIIPGLSGVIDGTEKYVYDAAGQLKPLLEAHAGTITKVDEFATSKVSDLVNHVTPYVDRATQVKDQVETKYRDTKKNVEDTIAYIDSTVQRTVAPTVDLTARWTDRVVERVLPEPVGVVAEGQGGDEETQPIPTSDGNDDDEASSAVVSSSLPVTLTLTPELQEAVRKCTVTASKAKRRAYLHAMGQLNNVQTRASGTVERFKANTVDLIAYAQSMVSVEADMVDNHRQFAAEAADTIAKVTAAYVQQQRELLSTFVEDPMGASRATVLRTIAKAEAVQLFVKRQYDESVSREAFLRRMAELKEQARLVQERLTETVTEKATQLRATDLVARAEKLYWDFEDAADPYTLSLLKRIRQQLAQVAGVVVDAVEDQVTNNNDGDENEELVPTAFPTPQQAADPNLPVQAEGVPLTNPVFTVSSPPDADVQMTPLGADAKRYSDVAAPEDENDVGLVLYVRPGSTSPRGDIDHEDVLLPDSDRY